MACRSDTTVNRNRSREAKIPPTSITSMGVEMIVDLPHVRVERPLLGPEPVIGHQPERFQEFVPYVIGRIGPVVPPYDHRDGTYFTICYPSVLILGIPVSESVGLAKFTVGVVGRERALVVIGQEAITSPGLSEPPGRERPGDRPRTRWHRLSRHHRVTVG